MKGDMLRHKMPAQVPEERITNFREVALGFTPELALAESERCLNCKAAPCMQGCPVGVHIPLFISRVREGDLDGAAKVLLADNNLPAVCGRVCPQENQCEKYCIRREKLGGSVAIGSLERFVADHANEKGIAPVAPERGSARVAVVGTGPASLSCAADLAKAGVAVVMFEALHKPGGVLEYGIPEFRLPKERVVSAEIADVKAMGVRIETNVVVGRTVTIDSLFDKEGFSAVFIGSGAGLPRFMNIPGENLNGVFSANEFLTRNNLMDAYRDDYLTPVMHAKKVVVVGGGNVAMDAARTALRLGGDVTVVYRRTEVELPARREEVHHAKEEGVKFMMLSNPVEIIGDEKGWVSGIRCIRMELGEPDESGRRSPVPVPGSEFGIEADSVIMALGTSPNPLIARTTAGLETNRRGCLVADGDGVTTRPGVFAGGDAVTGAATVILAMGAGRNAAAAIDRYIKGLE